MINYMTDNIYLRNIELCEHLTDIGDDPANFFVDLPH